MATPIIQIAKLLIYNAAKSRFLVSCFVTQPKLAEGERSGQIFIIAEVKKTPSNSLRIIYQHFIDALIAAIKNNYYQQMTYHPGPVELTFESALQQTNQKLGEYIKSKEEEIPEEFLKNLSAGIGIVHNRQIHFSLAGTAINGHLIRKNKIISILPATEIVTQNNLENNPLKIFSHIISGHLESDDGILFSTESLLDYFSLEKAKRIIAENDAQKANQKFQELLAQIDNKTAIAAIIIKLASGPESFKKEMARPLEINEKKPFPRLLGFDEKPNIEDSIVKLLDNQETTRRIIAQAPFTKLKRVLTIFRPFSPKAASPQENQIVATIRSYAKSNQAKKKYLTRYRFLTKFLKIASLPLIPFIGLGNLLKSASPKADQITFGHLEKISRKTTWFKKFLNKLPLSGRLILALGLILGIIFVQSIFWLKQKNLKQQEIIAYNQSVAEFEKINNEAEAALIYGDEEKARGLWRLMAEKAGKLPQDDKEKQKKVANLLNQANIGLNKINRLESIDQPALILDTGLLSFFKTTKIQEIIWLKSKLYAYNPGNNELYAIDPATGEIKPIKNAELTTRGITRLSKSENDKLYLLDDSGNINWYNPEKNIITVYKITKRNDLEIKDFAVYNEKLYLLAADKNLILKYSQSGASYVGETAWNKGETNFREAISMAVDGSIWLLETNGQIINLLKGIDEEFKTPTIEPPLVSPVKIWASKNSNNLYLADAATKRIICLTKQGKLNFQLTSDKFSTIKDFAVDEAGKKLYILDETKIYEIGLE